MSDIIYSGKCPVCGMGRMETLFDISEEKCFAMCEECEAEFDSPKGLSDNIGGKRVYFKDKGSAPKVRFASEEEALRDGFTELEK